MLAQFLSAKDNLRTDRYGGSLENRARAMQERHDLNAIAQAELDTIQNVGLVKGSAGFVTQMIGGMSHPIDFSMNLIPFVGSAKLAKGATGPLSAAMTRGLLISEETIAKHVTFPRITAAVIDATAGNILAEIPVAVQARRNKEEYGTEDFAVNILGGALIAGGLKGITLGLARAREAHARLTPEIQDRMLKDAIQQIAVGKSPDVHSHATIDPKLMEAEWKAREAEIRASMGAERDIPLGVNRAEIEDVSLRDVPDAEFETGAGSSRAGAGRIFRHRQYEYSSVGFRLRRGDLRRIVWDGHFSQ
jgi:hypothetical protein